jgi:hypothetical protein
VATVAALSYRECFELTQHTSPDSDAPWWDCMNVEKVSPGWVRSTSVGDVVECITGDVDTAGEAWMVMRMGWEKIR